MSWEKAFGGGGGGGACCSSSRELKQETPLSRT